MAEEDIFSEHSAPQATGFDYQFYYFIYYTLRMENEDDVVGYEKKDDVHIALKGEKIELCQIKHSNDKSPLTDSSVDLWNTLATWADVLSASTTPEIYSFAFVTNRPNNSDFIKQIIDFKVNYKSNFEDIKNSIQKLYNLTISRKKKKDKESENEKHQKTVINLDEKLFKMLFNNISFHFSDEDIIDKCAKKIANKFLYHTYEKAKSILNVYFAMLNENKFKNLKNKGFFSLSFKELRKEYGHILNPQTKQLITRMVEIDNPRNTDNLIFLKQLHDIHYIESRDEEIEYNADRIYAQNNIKEWQIEDLSDDEYNRHISSAISEWKIRFKKHNRKLKGNDDESLINETACDIVDEVKEIRGNFGANDARFDNGVYWMLSDEPTIGWRKDWEKYKSEPK
ncbi:MAG: hypothetical protein IKP73_01970 [Bacteroidales bacterium]|nr:hypothetical protein [Bacteroidales bacterium]